MTDSPCENALPGVSVIVWLLLENVIGPCTAPLQRANAQKLAVVTVAGFTGMLKVTLMEAYAGTLCPFIGGSMGDVSVIVEDWKWRMVTPKKGVFEGVPLNALGRKIGESWDPARDEAAGERLDQPGPIIELHARDYRRGSQGWQGPAAAAGGSPQDWIPAGGRLPSAARPHLLLGCAAR